MKIVAMVWAITIALLAGCAVQREARLYPANDLARTGGVLTGKFVANGSGHGTATITLPTGEQLNGEFTIVRGGAMGFGSIYGQVYGPGGVASVTGSSSSYVVEGSSPGTASVFGQGISMDCEFYNDNHSGHGFGACRNSKGALYKLQY
jgi:hypothetical protein